MAEEQTEAVDKLAEIIKTVIRGWPVYAVVVGILVGYGELWLDNKIASAIKAQTMEQPAVVTLTNSVQNNTNAIEGVRGEVGLVRGQVEIVEEDTKAILRIMAGDDN